MQSPFQRSLSGSAATIASVFILAAAAPAYGIAHASAASVVALRTEYLQDPLGIDVTRPRFSWQLSSAARGVAQTAYQIRVARSEAALRDGADLVWDSGKTPGDRSIQQVYGGPDLISRQRYFWQVRVWDLHGVDLGWSATAHWEMGLMSPQDWTANWIGAAAVAGAPQTTPPMLRREFALGGAIKSARLYVTSHGLYRLALNGKSVSEDLLTPGWTSYNHRLQYQTYDVTEQLHSGANAIGAYLGNGWFKGVIGFEGNSNRYGNQLALLLQLEVTFQDGKTVTIVSDERWKSSTGPILMADIYDGETYDARLEKTGWSSAGYDDHDWTGVQDIVAAKDVLIAPEAPPVRRIQELVPKRIFKTPGGDTVVDFGQNMVGWVRLKVKGPTGTAVTLRHAEVLDRSGNFYTDNLRAAKQTIRYILKGNGLETFEPQFTFQGFRYVAVDGYPGKLLPSNLTGVVVHSAMARTGDFSTSRPLINQLQHNVIWGQKGNFVDVPTDCPQRDERLGWTGDAEVFSATAAFNMDVAGFFTKWLKDLAADQFSTGAVPFVVPDILSTPARPAGGAAGWGDAATVIPWNMYLAYGDLRMLEQQYPSMQKWVDYEQARAGADNIWDGDFQFGDWLDFFSTAKNTRFGSTSPDLIATAYFAHSTDILQRSAVLLGKTDDAARYGASLGKIKEAFREKFIAADGTIAQGTQAAYVIALDFDLVPESLQAPAAQKLAQDVRERGHLTTGFLGTPHLLSVLARYGYLTEAYALLNREEFPSWLYPVKQGATTIWERWDGLKPDGSFQNKDMNSFNHYAYGAVGDWMYSVIGGINIDPSAPGYKHVLIEPQPGGGFTQAFTSHLTPYGQVSSQWSMTHQKFRLIATVPANTTATIRLPNADIRSVIESGNALASDADIISARQDGSSGIVQVGSGRYEFSYVFTAVAQ
jgi:alpha-L-rhamnosidase